MDVVFNNAVDGAPWTERDQRRSRQGYHRAPWQAGRKDAELSERQQLFGVKYDNDMCH